MLIWKQTRSSQRKHPRRMLILVPKLRTNEIGTNEGESTLFLGIQGREEVDTVNTKGCEVQVT